MAVDLFITLFDVLSLIIGLGYPIWRSYKVVEAKKFDDELTLWLFFWILHASVRQLETFSSVFSTLLSVEMPGYLHYLYKLVKLLVSVWLFHPHYRGALYIYFGSVRSRYKFIEEPLRNKVGALLTTMDSFVHRQISKSLSFVS